MGEAQKFITALCRVYGLDAHHAVEFEFRVRKADRKGINRIDGFFPGLLLIEMKSRGEDLEAAFNQALEYVQLLESAFHAPHPTTSLSSPPPCTMPGCASSPAA